MLYLIGLGIGNEKDLTICGLETAKKCECFLESYTSKWENFSELEKLIGKKIILLERTDIEEDIKKLLDKAEKNNIALFVPGDPLVATTHIDIIIEAKKKKIPVKIIHNTSILTAVGECGLQLYKFGKTATIPFTKHIESVKNAFEDNKSIGLHTLFLLDVDSQNNNYMTVPEAVKILIESDIIDKKEKIIAVHIGSHIVYDSAENLLEKNIETPSVIIIPGKLHFKEKEFLELL